MEIFDATFVDDEAILVQGATPALLSERLQCVLATGERGFTKYHLKLNWGPGKSEAVIRYRGRCADTRPARRAEV